MHIFKHFRTITRHRHMVMRNCFRCGLYRQGLGHDLSKYGWTEFMNGAKYYLGTKSPHHAERSDKGYSEAWMHHYGRNKHHVEYWYDYSLEAKKYVYIEMPNRYLAESICDRIAASKNYNKKKFTPQSVLDYFLKEGGSAPMHENTRKRMDYLLRYYVKYGEKKLFKFIKRNLRNKKTTFDMQESVI